MIIVTGSRRTGTSLAMQVLKKSGYSCFSVKTEMDLVAPNKNQSGYFDSTPFIKKEGTLPASHDAIKLFDFDIKKLHDFNFLEHDFLICIRHPLDAIYSEQAVLSEIKKPQIQEKKLLKSYVKRYRWIKENIIDCKCKFSVIDFDEYPNNFENFFKIASNATVDTIASSWNQEDISIKKSREAAPESISSLQEFNEAMEIYNEITT